LGRLLDAAVGLGLLSGDRRGYGLTPMTRMYLLSVSIGWVDGCCWYVFALQIDTGSRGSCGSSRASATCTLVQLLVVSHDQDIPAVGEHWLVEAERFQSENDSAGASLSRSSCVSSHSSSSMQDIATSTSGPLVGLLVSLPIRSVLVVPPGGEQRVGGTAHGISTHPVKALTSTH
jgi:hypothetical protein